MTRPNVVRTSKHAHAVTKESLPFDATLSLALLELFTTGIPTLPATSQKSIQQFFCRHEGLGLSTALHTLCQNSPLYPRLLGANNNQQNVRADMNVLLPSLFAWAQQQPWSSNINWLTAMEKWHKNCVRDADQPNDEVCAFLDRYLALVPNEPLQCHVHFAKGAFTYLLSIQNKLPPDRGFVRTAISMALLAQPCEKTDHFQGTLVPTWRENFVRVVGNFTTMARDSEMRMFMESSLDTTLKAFVLKEVPCPSWADPEIVPFLREVLPEDECERFKCIPWQIGRAGWPIKREEVTRENQQMMALYCPELRALVDVLANDNYWWEPGYMARMVNQCRAARAPQETLELPQEWTASMQSSTDGPT